MTTNYEIPRVNIETFVGIKKKKTHTLRDLVSKVVRVKNSGIIHNALSHSNVGYSLQSWWDWKLKVLSSSLLMWNK